MNARTFRETYCERFRVPLEAFEKGVFYQCLFPHTVALARMIERLRPTFFAADFDLIRSVADCTTAHDVRAEMSSYRYHHRVTGFWRRLLRVRVSGQKLIQLASQCFQ